MSNKAYIKLKKSIIRKVILLVLFIVLSIGLFKLSALTKSTITVKHKEDGNINYLVYLKESAGYPTDYLEAGKLYIASYIDYIDVNFNYNFKINDEMNYTYFYKIDADINVFEKGNEKNNIYHNTKSIVDTKTFTNKKDLEFFIKENIKINYAEYNDFVRSFKSNANIVADSTLTLTLSVDIVGNHKSINGKITPHSEMSLIIPLTEQMINIKMNQNNLNKAEVTNTTVNESVLSKVLKLSGYGLSVINIILVVGILFGVIKLSQKKNPYVKKVNQLLREYDRLIVEIDNDSTIKGAKNMIMVKSFEELLDVSDRLEKPILYLETVKHKTSQFIVREADSAYFFVLDSNDMRGK